MKYNINKAKYVIKMCTPDQLTGYASKTTEEIFHLLLSESSGIVFKSLCALANREINENAADVLKEVNDNGKTFKNRKLANNFLCQLFPDQSKNLSPGESKQIGYVYFIKDEFSGFIKIGRTKNIERRVALFTKLFSFPIQLIRYIQTLNYEKIEKGFHNHYKKKRVRGEWFKLDEADVEQILQKVFPKEIEVLIIA